MKIKVTEIEASAEELRQSNTLADGLTRMLRNAFAPQYSDSYEEDSEVVGDENADNKRLSH